jgi:hypothetical protein
LDNFSKDLCKWIQDKKNWREVDLVDIMGKWFHWIRIHVPQQAKNWLIFAWQDRSEQTLNSAHAFLTQSTYWLLVIFQAHPWSHRQPFLYGFSTSMISCGIYVTRIWLPLLKSSGGGTSQFQSGLLLRIKRRYCGKQSFCPQLPLFWHSHSPGIFEVVFQARLMLTDTWSEWNKI